MSASNRAGAIAKLHTALKKHYNAEPAQPTRPLLEHILYASLLEDCPVELADEGLAKCEQEFFDWNEVRVTTVTELSQVLSRLPDSNKAATRLKSNLQAIFEQFYTFDLDHLKKENLGKAVAKFEQMPGMTPFVLNYTVQHGLGGHAIPIDYSAMVIMLVTGIATQSEAVAGRVPGLERAVPKNKAIEFSSLLHQAAVALNQDPKDKTARSVLDLVEKGASNRLDDWLSNKVEMKKQRAAQRVADRIAAEEAETRLIEEKAAAPAKGKSSKKAEEAAAKPAPAKPSKKPVDKPAAEKEEAAPTKAPSKKSVAPEKPAAGKPVPPKAAAEKPAAEKPATKAAEPKKSESKSSPSKTPAPKSSDAKSPTKSNDSKSTGQKSTTGKSAEAKPSKKSTPSKSAPAAESSKKPLSAKKSAKPEPKLPVKKTPPKSSKPAAPAAKPSTSKPSPPKASSSSSANSGAKPSGEKKTSNRKLTKSKPR